MWDDLTLSATRVYSSDPTVSFHSARKLSGWGFVGNATDTLYFVLKSGWYSAIVHMSRLRLCSTHDPSQGLPRASPSDLRRERAPARKPILERWRSDLKLRLINASPLDKTGFVPSLRVREIDGISWSVFPLACDSAIIFRISLKLETVCAALPERRSKSV